MKPKAGSPSLSPKAEEHFCPLSRDATWPSGHCPPWAAWPPIGELTNGSTHSWQPSPTAHLLVWGCRGSPFPKLPEWSVRSRVQGWEAPGRELETSCSGGLAGQWAPPVPATKHLTSICFLLNPPGVADSPRGQGLWPLRLFFPLNKKRLEGNFELVDTERCVHSLSLDRWSTMTSRRARNWMSKEKSPYCWLGRCPSSCCTGCLAEGCHVHLPRYSTCPRMPAQVHLPT